MTSFVNPLKPRGGAGYGEALSRIRAWTRARLPEGDPVISVNELACAEPGCPPRETSILVMWSGQPAWKLRVHQAMTDVREEDIVAALSDVETVEAKSRLP